MIKNVFFYISISSIITFICLGFNSSTSANVSKIETNNNLNYCFPSQNQMDYFSLKIPYTGKFFIGFKEAVAHKESQGKYKKINSLGYIGKYQFGNETLKDTGIHNQNHFLNNSSLQEKAFIILLSKNKYELKSYINYFEGKTMDGITITESGILAAAHLGGINSVKRFLNSNGKKKCKDQYGTSVKSYLKDFSGFDTHSIEAIKDAKIE